ncbi:MAG: hypothetical protein H7X77_04880 [Anaerolineae bacterium]|nr:hypothetical protein [Anaerolineae bacterium]
MAHDIYWLNPGRVLYVSYQGHQTPETLKTCLDDMAAQLDTVTQPIFILINWLEVTSAEKNVLKSQHGHRAYSHPMAGRGVLVGFDAAEAFENEVTAYTSRRSKNTQYFKTLEEAEKHLKAILEADMPG